MTRPHSRSPGLVQDALAVLGVYVLGGVLGGALWRLLWEPAVFTKVKGAGGTMGELQLSQLFEADGWYVVIAALAGLCLGVGVTAWRSRDLVATTLLVVLGAGVAATVMALTGHLLGPGDPDAALAVAEAGETVRAQLDVNTSAAYLVWPIASLVGALVVLWSPPNKSAR